MRVGNAYPHFYELWDKFNAFTEGMDMQSLRFLVIGTCAFFSTVQAAVQPDKISKKLAEWSIVAYIQADNNLSPFAEKSISDMQLAPLTDSVNMLIQWDQPGNNKTWRYRIVNGGRIEDASLAEEMGVNPVKELIDMAAWAKSSYNAKRWCIVLWNHGSGIIDPRFRGLNRGVPVSQAVKQRVPWLEIPGLSIQRAKKDRGILFDDSHDTYATNQDLYTAFSHIKHDVLGKNVDIIGMDACYMAMLEVGYQIKDFADVLVASEQSEPGDGWRYGSFLTPLCMNPAAFTASALGATIVSTYDSYYKNRRETYYTQSAMDLSKLEAVKQSIDEFITAVAGCKQADATRIKIAIRAARRATIALATSDYVDLYSFYSALATQISRGVNEGADEGKLLRPSALYNAAAYVLLQVLNDGMRKIMDAVIANAAGQQMSGVQGISIYYPKGKVHVSYPDTIFAQSTQWVRFVKEYQ